MIEDWPMVRLGDVVSPVSRPERTEPDRSYPLLGAHWYARGLYTKETKFGRDIGALTLYRVHAGDFVYNRLFAWMGSFALASRENNDCYVSNEFRCFEVDEARLHPEFLFFYFARQEAWSRVLGLSTGSTPTSRNRLKDDRFLAMSTPLPSIDKQREIVAVLQDVAKRVAQADVERAYSQRAVRALGSSLLNDAPAEHQPTRISELLQLRSPDVAVDAEAEYNFAGVYSFGRGVFRGPTKNGGEISYRQLTRLHQGDFVYPKLMAWEGAFGVAGAEHEGLVVSPEFPVFELDARKVLGETLYVYFAQPDVWRAVSGASRGTNVRRRRLHPLTLLAHVMPLPSMAYQMMLREVVRASAQLLVEQDEVARKLAALMPSILHEVFAKGLQAEGVPKRAEQRR